MPAIQQQDASEVLSKAVFRSINSRHEYREQIQEYAQHGLSPERLSYYQIMNLTKLYIKYAEEDVIDIEVSKESALNILQTNDYITMSKIIGDLEGDRDEIICSIVRKYASNISEDLDEEIELIKEEEKC